MICVREGAIMNVTLKHILVFVISVSIASIARGQIVPVQDGRALDSNQEFVNSKLSELLIPIYHYLLIKTYSGSRVNRELVLDQR